MARAGLSREAVVALALQVVDDGGTQGFADLTLAKVAAAAGVATPSLYKHIGSLGDLRRAVATVSVTELTRECARATIGRSGPDALAALAHALRAFALAHPGRYASTQVAPSLQDPADAGLADAELAAAAAEVVSVIAAVLRGFDLPAERTVDGIRATRSAIHGFVSLELGGGFGMPEDVDQSFEVLVDLLVSGVTALATSSDALRG